MDQDPTTEERAANKKAMPETVKEPGLPEKVSQLRQKLGPKAKQEPSIGHCACLRREFSGEPDAGNLHIRFDEGRGSRSLWLALPLLLYRLGWM